MSYAIETPTIDKLAIYERVFSKGKKGKSIIFCPDGIITLNESLDKFFKEDATEADKISVLNSQSKLTRLEEKKSAIIEALDLIIKGGFIGVGNTGVGLTDSFIVIYSEIHIGNQVKPCALNGEGGEEANSNNDIMLNENGHYSSLPLIKGQRYLFDSAGNLHQYQSGIVRKEITERFFGIQSLNPFGLDYQNDSKACGIWSANILNQVQIYRGKIEIVKTYTGSDKEFYQILNPEILLRATAQVSKDLTPKGESLELIIPPQNEKRQKEWFKTYNKYTPLKIGNTTFAIDTTYRPDRCIDIEAIALSIPEKELINDMEVNRDFIKKQSEIFSNYTRIQKETRIDVIKKASNILFNENSRKECLREDLIGKEYVKARLKALNSKRIQNALVKSKERLEKPHVRVNIVNFP